MSRIEYAILYLGQYWPVGWCALWRGRCNGKPDWNVSPGAIRLRKTRVGLEDDAELITLRAALGKINAIDVRLGLPPKAFRIPFSIFCAGLKDRAIYWQIKGRSS